MIHANVSAKSMALAKKVIVGILAHAFVRILGIFKKYCW